MRDNKKMARLILAALIGGCTAKVSFHHMYELALHHGQSESDAWMYPIMVDAMMLYCSFNLSSGPLNHMAKFWCRVGMYGGIALSVAGNLLVSNLTDTVTAGISVVPAGVLFVVVEIMIACMKSSRAGQGRGRTRKAPAAA